MGLRNLGRLSNHLNKPSAWATPVPLEGLILGLALPPLFLVQIVRAVIDSMEASPDPPNLALLALALCGSVSSSAH